MDKFIKLASITKSVVSDENFPSLRGVAVDWKDNTILMYFYNDGPISEELENDFRCVSTEVVAQYSTAHIHNYIQRVDGIIPLPYHCYWAYRNSNTMHTALCPVVSTENIDLVQQTKYMMNDEVFASLRGLAVEWEDKSKIGLYIYYDGALSEEMKHQYEHLGEKLSKMYRSFHIGQDHDITNAVVNKKIIRVDAPASLPFHTYWVYQNRNAFSDFS